MLLIVIYHYHAREFNTYVINNESIIKGYTSLSSTLLHSIGKLGVPIFVFISGYYGIKFKKDRLLELIFIAFFYTILSSIISLSLYDFPITKYIFSFLNQWWFLTAYIFLYVLADGINFILEKTSKKQMLLIIIIFYYISLSDIIIQSANIGGLYLMITMYISSRWIKIYYIDIIKKYAISVFVILLFIRISLIFIGYNYFHAGIFPFVNSYVNPMSTIIAASIFCIFQKMPEYKRLYPLIMKFSASSLSIYLFSESKCGQSLFAPLFPNDHCWSLFHYLIGSLILYIIIVFIDTIRINILKKTYNIINKI